jgi:hypothetical protein
VAPRFVKRDHEDPKLTENTTEDTTEGLLRQIRDLLVPIAAHYQPEYDEAQARKCEERKATVAGMLAASPKRRAAWNLADGSRSQREISKQSTLDEGATSKFFKALRDIGAVDGANPKRTLELD